MVTLGRGPPIPAGSIVGHLTITDRSIDGGGVVVGVTHSRGGVLREDRFQIGTQFRGDIPGDPAHPVTLLLPDPDTTLTGTITITIIRQRTIRVQNRIQMNRHRTELIRPHRDRDGGELFLRLHPSRIIHPTRQVTQKRPDDPHVITPDHTRLDLPCGRRQHRLHRLTRHRQPFGEVRGFEQSGGRFFRGDPQRIRQHIPGPLPTELLPRGFGHNPDQPIAETGHPPLHPLQRLQHPQRGSTRIRQQHRQAVERGIDHGNRAGCRHRILATRTHVLILGLIRTPRQNFHRIPCRRARFRATRANSARIGRFRAA
ncbi:hypothetical protein SKPI104516_11690 [Skermania piniformis]